MVNFLLNFYLKYPNLFKVFIPLNDKYKFSDYKNVEYIEVSRLFNYKFDEVVVIAPEEDYCLYNLLKKFISNLKVPSSLISIKLSFIVCTKFGSPYGAKPMSLYSPELTLNPQ